MIIDTNNKIVILRSVVCKNKLWRVEKSQKWKVLHISPVLSNYDVEMIHKMVKEGKYGQS